MTTLTLRQKKKWVSPPARRGQPRSWSRLDLEPGVVPDRPDRLLRQFTKSVLEMALIE